MEMNYEFPPGYRFRPTDEELIFYYLGNKITNKPLPYEGIIHDVLLYNHSPDQLTAMFNNRGEDAWYFFTPRDKKYKNGSRPDRAVVGYGYWKPSGKDHNVPKDGSTPVIGTRRTLCYYENKPPNGNKTNWKMQEFVAKPNAFSSPRKDDNGGDDNMRLDEWVVCKIYQSSHDEKKGKGGDHDSNGASTSSSQPSPSPSPSPSPRPSQITHVMSSNTNGGLGPQPYQIPCHHIMSSTNGGFLSSRPLQTVHSGGGLGDFVWSPGSLPFPRTVDNKDEKKRKGGDHDSNGASTSSQQTPSPKPSKFPNVMSSTNGGFQPPPFQSPHHVMSSTNDRGFWPPPQTQNHHHIMSSSNGGFRSPPMQPFYFGGLEDVVSPPASLQFHTSTYDMSNMSGSSLQQPRNYGGSSIPARPIINNVVVRPPESSEVLFASTSSNCNDKYMEESQNCFGGREFDYGQASNTYCDSPEPVDFDLMINFDDELFQNIPHNSN